MGEQWILDLKEEKFGSSAIESQRWRKRCIYRVPKFLRDLNPNAYTPSMASFGPFHHDAEHLKPMEAHKRRLFHRFLRFAGKSAEDVVEAVRREVEELIECYEGLHDHHQVDTWKKDHDYTKNKFLEVMVVDGCFLLEILLVGLKKQQEICDHLDPVFGKNYVMTRLVADMLLLENQLPFRVLQLLVGVGGESIGTTDALSLLLEAHCSKEGLAEDIQKTKQELHKNIQSSGGQPALHCLDIYRRCMISKGDFFYNQSVDLGTASELVDSGVHLGTSQTKSFKDITFAVVGGGGGRGFLKKGVLRLPEISVDDSTESLLLNLVAFEQTHVELEKHDVLAYVLFMDGLVDTGRDVALLRKEGIVKGWLGSDDEIARLFNRLAKEVAFQGPESGTVDVNTELREYRRRCWPKTYRAFSQAYLDNFWKFLSLLGALFLLALTVLQTVYTLLSYYHS